MDEEATCPRCGATLLGIGFAELRHLMEDPADNTHSEVFCFHCQETFIGFCFNWRSK